MCSWIYYKNVFLWRAIVNDFLSLFVSFLSGCAQIGSYTYNGPPKASHEHAVIGVAGPNAIIRSIGGRSKYKGDGVGIINRYFILPGEHEIEVTITTGHLSNVTRVYTDVLTYTFKAGHKYEVDSELVGNGKRRFFMRDWGSSFDEECFDVRYRNGVFNPEGKCPW